MTTASDFEICLQLLRRLEGILASEGGEAYLPGIESVRRVGEEGLLTGDAERAMTEMGRMYRGMHSGKGGFSDFFVWRSTTAERRTANQELEQTKNKLWSMLVYPGQPLKKR